MVNSHDACVKFNLFNIISTQKKIEIETKIKYENVRASKVERN